MGGTRQPGASEARSGGPGGFITHRIQRLESGAHRVATSRRHRKGLAPHEVARAEDATDARPTSVAAFRHLVAPRRLGWWIALFFGVGSAHFLVAGLASCWPAFAPAALRSSATQALVYFVGSLFFTTAAALQWLEAVNGDVADALEVHAPPWRWVGWRPRNLGYLASAVQLAGTLFFNFSTAAATTSGEPWQTTDLQVWVPNMLGCVCFLAASYLALAEVSHGAASFAPRSVSWWIAVVNLAGSVAFQASALASFEGPAGLPAARAFWASLTTGLGATGFLVGAYLLIPELFDEEPGADGGRAQRDLRPRPPHRTTKGDRRRDGRAVRAHGHHGVHARVRPRRRVGHRTDG